MYSVMLSHSGTLKVQCDAEPFWRANVQCDAEPFWHANVQYNGEPFWHANVQCDAEPFWHAKVQCDAEPFWHANVQYDAEPFYSTVVMSCIYTHRGAKSYNTPRLLPGLLDRLSHSATQDDLDSIRSDAG